MLIATSFVVAPGSEDFNVGTFFMDVGIHIAVSTLRLALHYSIHRKYLREYTQPLSSRS